MLTGPSGTGRPSAGYNRNSFFQLGREEPLKGGRDEEEGREMFRGDEGWDVYADFNNAGPRYSSAFGLGANTNSKGYEPLQTPTRSDAPEGSIKEGPHKTEMVTVPVMGAEWTKRELRNMTKSGRKADKAEARRDKMRDFWRGNNGICGIRWLTRKVVVIVIFIVLILIGIFVGIMYPRVPAFGIDAKNPLKSAAGTDWNNQIQTTFSHNPTNFSFPAYANLQADTNDAYVPVTFNNIKAEVIELTTGRSVATGNLGHYKFAAKDFPSFHLPLNFTYSSANETDQTWANFYNACKSKQLYSNNTRPGLQFKLLLEMSIVGFIGSPRTSVEVSNGACPIELPTNV
jgi:hypothetical protein